MEEPIEYPENASSRMPVMFQEENLDDEFILIKNMKKIKCNILENGLKPVKMKYFFCSCDPNKIDPICEECALRCHSNHLLSSPYEGPNVCACGLKGHNVTNDARNMTEYKQICPFFDIANISGKLVYYINERNEKICMFCNVFCNKSKTGDNPSSDLLGGNNIALEYNFDKGESEFYENEKIILNKANLNDKNSSNHNNKEINKCECSHENHSNIKKILQLTNNLGEHRVMFENLSPNQLLNILFLSENIYLNNYSLFEDYANKKFNFRDQSFKIDFNIHLTNYYYSIMNFFNISKSFDKHIRYANDKICGLFDFYFIYNVINLNLSDNIYIWSFYNFVFGIFKKCYLGNMFTRMTKFRISDLENLSLMQRLCFLKYKYSEEKNESINNFPFIKYFLNEKEKNIIDIILRFFESLVRCKFSSIEGLELTLTIVSIIYRISSYYLIESDQKQRFIVILENCIRNFNTLLINFKDNNKKDSLRIILAKIFVKVIKTIIYLAYEENDSIIYNEFIKNNNLNDLENAVFIAESEEKLKNLKFFHMKNDFGMNVSKVFIQILDLSRQEFHEIEQIKDKNKAMISVIDDLFRYQNHLLSIFIRSKDSYMIGLRAFFHDNNNNCYLKFFENKTQSFNLENHIESIESVYHRFVNLGCNKDEVITVISNILNPLLTKLNVSNSNKDQQSEIKLHLFYSEFLQCVLKSLKILSNKIGDEDKIFVDSVLELLKFFIQDSVDNSKLMLADVLFDYISEIPYTYSKSVFELILQAITILSKYQIEFHSTKSIIKRIYAYFLKTNLSNLRVEHINQTNYDFTVKNIELLLKIVNILLLDIPCLNASLSYEKSLFIIKDLYSKVDFVGKFIEFLVDTSIKYGERGIVYYDNTDQLSKSNNRNNENENNGYGNVLSDQIFKYKVMDKYLIMDNPLFFNIFKQYIKLMNISFGQPNQKDLDFARNLLSKENIGFILKNRFLDIQLRTELLMYLRKYFLDFQVDPEKNELYVSALSYNFNAAKKNSMKNDYNAELYSFLDDINSITERKNNEKYTFDHSIKNILHFELTNYLNFIENEVNRNSNSLVNYLEQGLFLTISVYFHKIYCNVELMNGEEFLHIYELFVFFLEMKNYYLSKIKSNKAIKNKEDISYQLKIDNKRKTSNLPTTFLGNLTKVEHFKKYFENIVVGSFKELENKHSANKKDENNPLDLIQNMSYSAFDYAYIYGCIESNLHNLVQKPSSLGLLSEYNKNEFNYENFYKIKSDLEFNNKARPKIDSNNLNNLMLKICYIYEKTKGDLNNSSISSILGEISMEKEVAYRNLFLNYLIFAGSNNQYFHKHFAANCDFIIFKLLQYHTGESQREIISILEKRMIVGEEEESKSDFLRVFADNLFNKLIRIFINNFNPVQSIYDNDYVIAFNIIKIFKFLCEEHNNYFQGLLIRKLSFKKLMLQKYATSIYSRGFSNKKISFFDLMLLTINKIIICSKWDKAIKDNKDYNIDYLYDLLAAIIELLIEIVQGNTDENLSYIGSEEINEEDINRISKTIKNVIKRSSTLFGDIDLDYEDNKNPNFEVFLTHVRSIIFLDSSNSKVLYRVRTNLMNFLISILEEKNCNKKIKDTIISTIPIEEVINSISSALKFHYFNCKEEKNATNDPSDMGRSNNQDSKFNKYENINNSNTNNYSSEGEDPFKKLSAKKFNMIMYNYYLFEYFNTEKDESEYLSEDEAFIFSNTYYHFIKIISLLYKDSEASYLLNKVELIGQNTPLEKLEEHKKHKIISNEIKPIDLVNDDELHIDEKFMETYLIVRFFEEITKTVEIRTEDKKIQRVIFTVLPTIKKLSEETKLNFIKHVNRENAFTKLNGLTESVNLFKEEIVYKTKYKPNKFQKFVSNINFYWIQVFLYVIALVINLIILLSVEGDTSTGQPVASAHRLLTANENSYNIPFNYRENMIDYNEINMSNSFELYNSNFNSMLTCPEKTRALGGTTTPTTATDSHASTGAANTSATNTSDTSKNNDGHSTPPTNNSSKGEKINDLIIKSIHENEKKYIPLTYVLIILGVIFTTVYSVGKLPMYYFIDKKNYLKKHNLEEHKLTFINKTYIVLVDSIYSRDQINTMIFITLISIIALSIPDEIISYTFMLLTLVNLIPTLSNIIVAVKIKYEELGLTYLLTCIIMWAHSSLGFYLFNEDFAVTIEGQPDNFCSDMIFCFLTSMDYGLRTRGGVGELIKRISFERNKGRYIARLFYDIIYFILIVVLMLELVFGIIVETFRDLRIEETKHDYDKQYICFICGVKKDDLEKNRQSFRDHCDKVHNVWNYINYMLRLKFSDPQDLNAINSFALENIENKKISWVPLIEKHETTSHEEHEEESTDHETEESASVNEEEREVLKINH